MLVAFVPIGAFVCPPFGTAFNISTTPQLLSNLPSTVRGVGLKLIGSFNRKSELNRKGLDGVPGVPGYNQDMATLVSYIAVVSRNSGTCSSNITV